MDAPAAGSRLTTHRRGAGRATTVAAVLLLTLALAACGSPASVQTAQRLPISVSPDGRGDYATLAAAVREAPSGATILLDSGTYRLTRPLDVFRSLSIVAPAGGRAIVESRATGRVLGFDGHGELRLSGLTVRSVGGRSAPPTGDRRGSAAAANRRHGSAPPTGDRHVRAPLSSAPPFW